MIDAPISPEPVVAELSLAIGQLVRRLRTEANPDELTWSQLAILARLPDTTIWWSPSRLHSGESVPGVLVFSPAAPLTFINASYIRAQFDRALAATPDARLAVIEASGITQIDYTASQSLIGTITRLRKRGIDVAMARLEADRAAASAARNGLLDVLGADHVFHSVDEAVRTLGPSQRV